MKNKTLHITLILLSFIFPVFSFADVTVKGTGEYVYSNFNKEPDLKERQNAIELAKENSILVYAEMLSSTSRELFERKRSHFLSNASEYILSSKIVSTELKKEDHLYTVIIEAIISDKKIKSEIRESYVSQNANFLKNNIALFFIARSTKNVIKTEPKKTSHPSEKESEIKEDVVLYDLDSTTTAEFGSHLMDVFSEKKMKNIWDGTMFHSMETVEATCRRENQRITAKEWEIILTELKDPTYQISYLILGTVDMGEHEIHPGSGQPMVSATVSIKIYDVNNDKKLPTLIAALRPIVKQEIGSNHTLAKKNALRVCAESAGEEIINKLRLSNDL